MPCSAAAEEPLQRNKDGDEEGAEDGRKRTAGGMLGGRSVGRSVGSAWLAVVCMCCPTYYLSSIIVLFILRRSRRKRFLKKVDPRDLFPVPIRFYLYLWYLVQMRIHADTYDTCTAEEEQCCRVA